MIKINFSEPGDQTWTEWRTKCDAQKQALIDAYNSGLPFTITDLYKGQKNVFIDNTCNFYGKCAYCESLITSNQPGDIDHFRPKGRVTNENYEPVSVENAAGENVLHPGYYWLSYEYTNLLPACNDCNRPSKGNSKGIKVGKWDRFPVKGKYAINPGEEVNEDALLINPTADDPAIHLEIDELGILHGLDEKGIKTIEILGLNLRESLIDERKRSYEAAKNSANMLIFAMAAKADYAKYLTQIQDHQSGRNPYSCAGRKGISDVISDNKPLSNFLNQV